MVVGMSIVRIVILLSVVNLVACSQVAHQDSPLVRENAARNQATTVEIALEQLGAPYRYGGHDPSGFDCSGLVYYAYQQQGIKIPRSTKTQLRYAKKIPRTALQSGDLVFFKISKRKVSHVGIYIGENRFVHSPSPGKRVHVSSLENPYWSKHYIRAGRI